MSGEHSDTYGILRRFRDGRDNPPFFEFMENRLLLSAVVDPAFLVLPQRHGGGGSGGVGSGGITNPNPVGLTPAQVRNAYGLNLINGNGAGQTIAIVDAYDDPYIASDLQKFDAAYGISNNDSTGQFALTKVVMSQSIAADSGWGLEISLDVEWAHAIAPGAHILLVEAASASYSALLSAVDYARGQPGVVAVSMSWGGSEFSGETAYDSHFTTPAGHAGEVFVAASGDTGGQVSYPAASPNVLSVGGTTLNVNSAGNYLSETAWSGSGGGISAYEPKPSYQSGVKQSATKRTVPDVAYDANPNTGVGVYDSFSYEGQSGWFQVGGTSEGAPQWSALIAIADQLRGAAGPLGNSFLSDIYSLPSTDFHDIVSGKAGRNSAGPGYDLVTGLGSPVANLIVQGLLTAPAVVTSGVLPVGTGSQAVHPALVGADFGTTAADADSPYEPATGAREIDLGPVTVDIVANTPPAPHALPPPVAAFDSPASDPSLSDNLLGELVRIL